MRRDDLALRRAASGNGALSMVLAGHPKLKSDLRRPTMEESGSRSDIFDLEGFGGDKLSYLKWLLAQCLGGKAKTEAADKIDVPVTAEALVSLCARPSTPLKYETYLARAFEEGYRVGQKPSHGRGDSKHIDQGYGRPGATAHAATATTPRCWGGAQRQRPANPGPAARPTSGRPCTVVAA